MVSSVISNFYSLLQSKSVEIVSMEEEDVKPVKHKIRLLAKRYCAKYAGVGLKACFKVASENGASIRDIPLYMLAGSHNISFSITPSKCWENSFCAFYRSTVHTWVKTVLFADHFSWRGSYWETWNGDEGWIKGCREAPQTDQPERRNPWGSTSAGEAQQNPGFKSQPHTLVLL